MVAVKAHQASSFLNSTQSGICAYLIYGSDAGLVSERGQQLARTIAAREQPPGEIVRVEDADLEANSDRLALELCTIPMFGGRKIVRTQTSRRLTSADLKPLIQGEPLAGILIVEAGNLKKDDATRLLFEKSPQAAAIPCYADEASNLNHLITEILGAHDLKINPEARQYLVSRLGADRMMSRGEIEKLALYAAGTGQVSEDDIEMIVGDASELAIDVVVQATASGDAAQAVEQLFRALSAGENAQTCILALQRHFVRLHRLRTAIDKGRSVDAVIQELRPPLHFKQKDRIAAQCRNWRGPALNSALDSIAQAARAARLNAALEDVLAERLVLSLARLARSQHASTR